MHQLTYSLHNIDYTNKDDGGFIGLTMLNYMQAGVDNVITSITRHQYS